MARACETRRHHRRINGACVSACAYVLGIMPKERVCVTPRAAFGFHMATDEDGDPDPKFTREIYARILPAPVQTWLAQQKPLGVDRITWLRAESCASAYSNGADEAVSRRHGQPVRI